MNIKNTKNVFKGKILKILKIWFVKILIFNTEIARSKTFCDAGFEFTILYYLVTINESMLHKDM